jgi:hypothetical protein
MEVYMRVYVLKIGYDPVSEEVIFVKEYIDKAKATLHLDGKDIELDDELAVYMTDDKMALA